MTEQGDPLDPGERPGAATDREFGEGPARRPVPYTAELAAYLLDEVASGRTIRDVCKERGMPSAGTVRRWVWMNLGCERGPDGAVIRLGFGDLMMQALELQAEALADECLEIADEKPEVEMVGDSAVVRNPAPHRALRIKTRQMIMGANARAKWGVQGKAPPPAAAALPQVGSAIRRSPGEPLLVEASPEPVAVRPATGGLVDGHHRQS